MLALPVPFDQPRKDLSGAGAAVPQDD